MKNNFTPIDEVLKVSERINTVEPKAFFYTRLLAKMEQQSKLRQQVLESAIPAYLKISGVVIILINAWFFVYQASTNKSARSAQDLASFYQINSNDPYTIE